MRKIPTVLRRNPDDMRHVLLEVSPGCEWVLDGEGVATRKFDGTCVMLDEDRRWWARREVKPGKQPPANFVAVEHDAATGKTVGWEPIQQSAFARWHAAALETHAAAPRGSRQLTPGTYELIGPKVNGNPEGWVAHALMPHGEWIIDSTYEPLTPEDLRDLMHACREGGFEGVVWHHHDGRRAKLKVRDFDWSAS